MGGRLIRIVILTLGVVLALSAISVFLFFRDIDAADQTASVLAAIIALIVSLFTLVESRREKTSATVLPVLDLRTEEEFLATWVKLEGRLREVAALNSSQSGAVPLKVLLKTYEALPGVTESDIQDFLMLLSIRNGIMHPTIKGAGIGRQSNTQAVSEAVLRQLSKLDSLGRGR